MEIMVSSLVATFMLGLSFGAGACLFTCIPTLGVVLLSQKLTPREVMLQTWRFNMGRITAYALMASISAALGASLIGLIDGNHANLIFAGVLLISAIFLWRAGKASGCSSHQQKSVKAGLFGMGFSMGLRPCAPLAGVMVAAAVTASWFHGLLLGLTFGLGAVVVPQIVFGYALGSAGAELRSQMRSKQHLMTRIGASILAIMGAGVGMGWIHL